MGALLGNGGVTMLFDLRPKERKEDLFGREKEVEELKKCVKNYPITLLLGIRRIGKSSVLRVALNDIKHGIYIDVRKMYFESGGWITTQTLSSNFEEALNSLNLGVKKSIIKFLSKIDGITIDGVSIRFKKDIDLSTMLESLNNVGVTIAFDEAQYFRFYGGRGGKEVLSLFAYIYDNMKNVSLIFTGSEVGLLHDFLGIDNYDSPLYGRTYAEIVLKPFKPDTSKDFLIKGFEETNTKITDRDIDIAVKTLDGIPGWLVEFGYNYVMKKDFNAALDGVVKKAKELVKGEIKELEKKSRRYGLILQAISLGFDHWEKIKKYVEINDRNIPNSRLAALLKNLESMSWIEVINGKYKIIDPVVKRVIMEMRL